MEFEILKVSHLKRNIIIGVIIIVIISTLILTFTRAKYRTTQSIKVAEGTINYKMPDLNLVSLYIQNEEGTYTEANNVPSSGYTLNMEQSYCGQSNNGEVVKDNSVSIIYENGLININGISKKGTKCYLYFDADASMTIQELIASKNIDNSRSGTITKTVTADTTGTVYSVQDDDGTSYVYAGAPTDNWVSFAGFYWRIIRINGDGSIRMIYAGTSYETSGADDQIGTSAYNISYNDNAYVGYMYGSTGQSSYTPTHANNNNSTIKGVLDGWYEENLQENYAQYLSTEAGFCNDRSLNATSETWWSPDTKRGYETNATAYGPYGRLLLNGSYRSSQNPSLLCSQTNDMFTVSESSKGNHELTYLIGLITSDEVVLAGGFGGSNNSRYYLYTGEDYWTMSPNSFIAVSIRAVVLRVYSIGSLGTNGSWVDSTNGVRPVINLSSDVTLSGSGTSTDPYTVVGA